MIETVEDFTKLRFKKPERNGPFDIEEGGEMYALVTLKGCKHCERMREKLKDDIEKGNITEINCSQDEGDGENFENLKTMVVNDITAFPTILGIKKKGGRTSICEMNTKTMKPEKCRVVTSSPALTGGASLDNS